jgi:retron-type reverse transcriptase
MNGVQKPTNKSSSPVINLVQWANAALPNKGNEISGCKKIPHPTPYFGSTHPLTEGRFYGLSRMRTRGPHEPFGTRKYSKDAHPRGGQPDSATPGLSSPATPHLNPSAEQDIHKNTCAETDFEVTTLLRSKFDNLTRKYKDIFSLIVSENNLILAWNRIKSKPGNSTPGADPETLDGIDRNWFLETSKKLSKGSYNYSPARRVQIPKPNKPGETRPLTIGNPRDKIIQQAFLNVLQPIFEGSSHWAQCDQVTYQNHVVEYNAHFPGLKGRTKKGGEFFIRNWYLPPIFLNESHGFRPGRSVHSALSEIKNYWGDPTWFLKFDVKKAFDRTNHNLIVNNLSRYIDDQRMEDEIRKMLKARIIDFNLGQEWSPTLGVPQGSVLSPFLFNVAMHSLDLHMADLSKGKERNAEKKENPVYASARYKLRVLSSKEGWSIRKKIRASRDLRKKLRRQGIELFEYTTLPQRVLYIRYADDLLIGIKGPKSLALALSTDITNFIKSSLHLEVPSAHIAHTKSDKVSFLGFLLSLGVLGPVVKGKTVERFKRLKSRVQNHRNMEYKSYLRMVSKAGEKYYRKVLEGHLRQTNQTMMGKLQLRLGGEALASGRAIEALQKALDDLKLNMSKGTLVIPRVDDATAAKKPSPNNPRYLEAEQLWEKEWGFLISAWINRASAIARIIPEKEADLLGILGEEALSELSSAREHYLSLLDKYISDKSSGKVVSYVYKTNLPKGKENTKGGGNASSLISTQLTNKRYQSRVNIEMPYLKIREKLEKSGILVRNNGKVVPKSLTHLLKLEDIQIIDFYKEKAYGILNFFQCADNRWEVIKVANWILRYSLLHTLAHKYHLTLSQTISKFSISPKVYRVSTEEGKELRSLITGFPTPVEINTREKRFNLSRDWTPDDIDTLLSKARTLLTKSKARFEKCCVAGCHSTDIEIHHIRKLVKRWKGGIVTIANKGKRSGTQGSDLEKVRLSALSRKQIPLCAKHHLDFHQGTISLKDLDPSYTHPQTLYVGGTSGALFPI